MGVIKLSELVKEAKEKYWLSPVSKNDDFGDKISDEIIDGATTRSLPSGVKIQGSWALMTPKSFKKYGVGKLGTGYGQRYKKQKDGKWLKVEG